VVVIGVGAHKRTHTLVAVDQVGRKLGERTVAATPTGHLQALGWAAGWPQSQVTFALEDCRHLTRRLEADLLRAGHRVVRVPTRLMATARRSGRKPGKSDPIDALAVAQAALREPDLPAAHLDGPTRKVKLLCDHRADLVVERTKLCNRLRWHLHELDPELEVPARGLRRYKVIDELAAQLARFDGVVAELAAELLGRCRERRCGSTSWNATCVTWSARWRRSCWPSPAAGCSARRPSWARPPAPPGSAPGMPLPASTAPLPSRCGRATPCGCGSTAVATAPSTGRCT
jgi:transposase